MCAGDKGERQEEFILVHSMYDALCTWEQHSTRGQNFNTKSFRFWCFWRCRFVDARGERRGDGNARYRARGTNSGVKRMRGTHALRNVSFGISDGCVCTRMLGGGLQKVNGRVLCIQAGADRVCITVSSHYNCFRIVCNKASRIIPFCQASRYGLAMLWRAYDSSVYVATVYTHTQCLVVCDGTHLYHSRNFLPK